MVYAFKEIKDIFLNKFSTRMIIMKTSNVSNGNPRAEQFRDYAPGYGVEKERRVVDSLENITRLPYLAG